MTRPAASRAFNPSPATLSRVVAGELVVASSAVDPRPPGRAVVALCVASAVAMTVVMVLAVAVSIVVAAPRRVVRRRPRLRYVGAHTGKKVAARG